MSEDVARAVGAGDPSATIVIGGIECVPRPLTIREIAELQTDCLDRYKQSVLKTYANNLHLFDKEVQSSMLEKKLEEVSKWTIDDLPPKEATAPDSIVVTKELTDYVEEISEVSMDSSKETQRVVAALLDRKHLSLGDYQKLASTTDPPRKYTIPYVHGWWTEDVEGMITACWLCFRHNGVTREQIADNLNELGHSLRQAASSIEALTIPTVGNG